MQIFSAKTEYLHNFGAIALPTLDSVLEYRVYDVTNYLAL